MIEKKENIIIGLQYEGLNSDWVSAKFLYENNIYKYDVSGNFEPEMRENFDYKKESNSLSELFKNFLLLLESLDISIVEFSIYKIESSKIKFYVKHLIQILNSEQFIRISDRLKEVFESQLKIKLKKVKNAKKLNFSEIYVKNINLGIEKYFVGKVSFQNNILLITGKDNELKASFSTIEYSFRSNIIETKYFWYFKPVE